MSVGLVPPREWSQYVSELIWEVAVQLDKTSQLLAEDVRVTRRVGLLG